MDPAELKTLREALGLSTEWLRAAAGVKHRRSVEYWESGRIDPRRGKTRVPPDVATLLRDLDLQLWEIAEQAVAQTLKVAETEGGPAEEIELWRYRAEEVLWEAHPAMAEAKLPVTTHAVILYRSQYLLRQHGLTAVIRYADE